MDRCVELEISKRDVFVWERVLSILGDTDLLRKLSYAVSKINRVIAVEAEDIRSEGRLPKSISKDERYTEYESKRVELNEKCARKDADGNFEKIGSEYKIEKQAEFSKGMRELKKEYADIVKMLDEHEVYFEEVLTQKLKLEFYELQYKLLPKKIKPNMLGPLIDLVVDYEECEDDDEDEVDPKFLEAEIKDIKVQLEELLRNSKSDKKK